MQKTTIILILALSLSACSTLSPKARPTTSKSRGKRYKIEQDVGPKSKREIPNIAKIPDAKPKVEPKSRIGNPKSYTVFKKRYQVLPSAKGYVTHGKASWYGKKFHGYHTSSGEPYDMYAMTAAHKTLPLPTYAKVTNLANGRAVIVKINDRGPFHGDRIIDLSYTAAAKLGILAKGTGNVRIEALDPANHRGLAKYLHVGTFNDEGQAKKFMLKLYKVAKNHPVSLKRRVATQNKVFQVHIGPIHDETLIPELKKSLSANNVTDLKVVSSP